MPEGAHPVRVAAPLLCSLGASVCRPPVHIATQLEDPDIVRPAAGFTADFCVSSGAIDISSKIESSEPKEVLWQKQPSSIRSGRRGR